MVVSTPLTVTKTSFSFSNHAQCKDEQNKKGRNERIKEQRKEERDKCGTEACNYQHL